MPVMVLYKGQKINVSVTESIARALADVTKQQLDAAIEVRVVETVYAYNANEIHIEMQFRDFGEWTNEQIATYHEAVMGVIGKELKQAGVVCAYSFYIIPSTPPRSIWAQDKSGDEND